MSAASQSSTSYSVSDLLAKQTHGRYVPVKLGAVRLVGVTVNRTFFFVMNSDALLVHLICNAIKMSFSICIWACAIVLNTLNSHVNQ